MLRTEINHLKNKFPISRIIELIPDDMKATPHLFGERTLLNLSGGAISSFWPYWKLLAFNMCKGLLELRDYKLYGIV